MDVRGEKALLSDLLAAQHAMNRWRRITRGFNGPRSSTGGFAGSAGGTREDDWCLICNRGSVNVRLVQGRDT